MMISRTKIAGLMRRRMVSRRAKRMVLRRAKRMITGRLIRRRAVYRIPNRTVKCCLNLRGTDL